ncbi:hypothetical protein [Longimicrobium sp.]|uniref:hypothetical protein n=1 Tax=Longimicrobium sp. TaxID=2029185 RepID=UPI002ED79859
MATMNLKERVEAHSVWWLLSALLAGFLAGLATYSGILRIASLHVVSQATFDRLEENAGDPSDNGGDTVVAQREALRRRLDAEISRRLGVFLGDLALWQFSLQSSNQLRAAAEWRQLEVGLFAPPATSGAVSNVYPEFRKTGIKELFDRVASISPPPEQLEIERAMEELSQVERIMAQASLRIEDPGTSSQRVLEAISRNPAFERWIGARP